MLSRFRLLPKVATFEPDSATHTRPWSPSGLPGTGAKLNQLMRAGDLGDGGGDEMLNTFALVARWDDMADALVAR